MEQKPLFSIGFTVKSQTRKQVVDKLDTFTVDLKSDGEFTVGMRSAKAKLSIKGEDSILQNLFPKKSEFVIAIYTRIISEPLPEEETEQTPLAQDGRVNQAFADAPEDHEETESEQENPD